jgi:hypothetical protein
VCCTKRWRSANLSTYYPVIFSWIYINKNIFKVKDFVQQDSQACAANKLRICLCNQYQTGCRIFENTHKLYTFFFSFCFIVNLQISYSLVIMFPEFCNSVSFFYQSFLCTSYENIYFPFLIFPTFVKTNTVLVETTDERTSFGICRYVWEKTWNRILRTNKWWFDLTHWARVTNYIVPLKCRKIC